MVAPSRLSPRRYATSLKLAWLGQRAQREFGWWGLAAGF